MQSILILTRLFPNKLKPINGIFVKKMVDVQAENHENKYTVLSLIPYIPRWRFFKKFLYKYYHYSYHPEEIEERNYKIFYKKYFTFPRQILLAFDWISYTLSAYIAIKRKNLKIDIIHSHWLYPDGFVAIILGKLLGKRVIVHAHGSDVYFDLHKKVIGYYCRYAINKADLVFVVSDDCKKKLLNNRKIRNSKVEIIYNGVDLNLFAPMDKNRVREKLGVPKDKKIILSVARLENKVKGVDTLVHALSFLDKKILPYNTYIIGDGKDRRNIEKMIKHFGLETMIFLMGEKNNLEIPAWLNCADLLIYSSNSESFGIALIEAMACGIPVIGTTVGGIPEIITSEDVGFLVPPKEPEKMANAIEKALTKDWNKVKIIEYAKKFTLDKTAMEMEKWYSLLRPYENVNCKSTITRSKNADSSCD